MTPAALRALIFASSAAGLLCAGQALAGDEPVVAADPQNPATLETVDVVGKPTRREATGAEMTAPVVDTPRAITIIPQQIIEQTAATSLQDILRTSPGITFGAGEGGQPLADRPFIRGQASANNVFVDGLRDSGGQQREVFNLEQVEVIKGPDSVYNGRGSGGGSINLASKSPRLTESTRAAFGVGTDGYLRATADVNHQIGDTAALRLTLMASQGDVPGRDSVDFDRWGVGAAFGAGLGTDTSLTAFYYHLTSNQMPDYGIPLFTKINVRTTASGVLDVPYDSFYGLTARDWLTTTADAFTVKIEHRVSDALTIRNVSRYAETLNDYVVTNPGDGGNITNGGVALIGGEYWMKRGTKSRWNPTRSLANVTDIFGEVRAGGLIHNYDVGLELARERNRNAAYVVTTTGGSACPAPLTGFDCTRLYDPDPSDPWTGAIVRGPVADNTADSVGVYAFDSMRLGERWVFNLGVRYDDYSVTGVDIVSNLPVARDGAWSFVNYQAGVVFKPTAGTSVYASYSTASTPPTISAGDQNTGTGVGTGNLATVLLDPEETTNGEIGAKAALFTGRLSLSAAAFVTHRDNAQIQVSPGVYEQAGAAEVRGIELAVAGNVTPAWQVFGGYTYMDSELLSGAYTNVNVGDPLANTPEHSASLFTTYRFNRRLTLGGGIYHVSDSFGGNQGGAGGGTNRIYAPAWTRYDLFGSLDLTERASLQLNVQNAGDADYIIRTNGVHHADVAPGRQAILTLNYRF